jgi:outer membrane biosynthesis protein TonB
MPKTKTTNNPPTVQTLHSIATKVLIQPLEYLLFYLPLTNMSSKGSAKKSEQQQQQQQNQQTLRHYFPQKSPSEAKTPKRSKDEAKQADTAQSPHQSSPDKKKARKKDEDSVSFTLEDHNYLSTLPTPDQADLQQNLAADDLSDISKGSGDDSSSSSSGDDSSSSSSSSDSYSGWSFEKHENART